MEISGDDSFSAQVAYVYNPDQGNQNGASLKTMATELGFSDTVTIFNDYYGDHDYADQFVMAAFNQQSLDFCTGKGGVDFSEYELGSTALTRTY